MKSSAVFLLLTTWAGPLLAACAPNPTIQLSIPTVGTVDISLGQSDSTPVPAEPAQNPTGPGNPGLDASAASFLYVLLAVIGLIVIGTAFALFMSRPHP